MASKKEKMSKQELKKLYYDINEPSSFRGLKTIINALRENNIKYDIDFVKKWLTRQKTYSIHQTPNFSFKRNPIVSKYIDHNWSADLIEIKKKGINYVLMVIDTLSKFGWGVPLKDKSAEIVKKAFLKIFRESKRKP